MRPLRPNSRRANSAAFQLLASAVHDASAASARPMASVSGLLPATWAQYPQGASRSRIGGLAASAAWGLRVL